MSFEEIPRLQSRRGNIAMTYSMLDSGHGNIYFLSEFAKLFYPKNQFVKFHVDRGKGLMACEFLDKAEMNSYTIISKDKGGEGDSPTGQVFVSSRIVCRLLRENGYPERKPIQPIPSGNLYILSKETEA